MSMHPDIIKLTHEMFPKIAEFIIQKEKESGKVGVPEPRIHEYFHRLSQEGNVEGLTFRYGTLERPWSTQLEYVITNNVRGCRLEDSGNSCIYLTRYGRTLMDKK